MSDVMVAFKGGKRVAVDPDTRTVTVCGRAHIDRIPFDKVAGRKAMYQRLHSKRPDFYKGHLVALTYALDVVNSISTEAKAT